MRNLLILVILTTAGVLGFLALSTEDKRSSLKDPRFSQQTLLQPPPQEPKPEATLALRYGDGRERLFKGGVIETMTVFDAIGQSADAGSFSVETAQEGEEEVWLRAVDGVAQEEGEKRWVVYKNGQDVDGNLMVEKIGAGDRIEVRYE